MGESITDLNTVFPHWFALNYRKYNGAPETLPVDHHELIALMAPRAVRLGRDVRCGVLGVGAHLG